MEPVRESTSRRFFDEGDFTKEHDMLNIWLMENWKKCLLSIPGIGPWDIVEGRYEAEPPLEGYPPIFPDGTATVRLYGDHKSRPLTLESVIGNTVTYACGRKTDGCYRKYQTQYRFASLRRGSLNKPRYWPDYCSGPELTAVFEIKPEIDSFGKVLRQMKLYEQRVAAKRRGRVVLILVTKDTRYDRAFFDQRVNPYHPRPQEEATLEDVRRSFPRAYEKWSQEEDRTLLNEYNTGASVVDLAKAHQRQPGAIRSRLAKLGMISLQGSEQQPVK